MRVIFLLSLLVLVLSAVVYILWKNEGTFTFIISPFIPSLKRLHDRLFLSSKPLKPESDEARFSMDFVASFCPFQPLEDPQLQKHNHLVLLGHVFDVSSNPQSYGEKGSYAFFTGRDATRAFVTGDFTPKGLVASIDGFTSAQYLDLIQWFDFMIDKYPCIGFHVGLYYHLSAEPTQHLRNFYQTRTLLLEQEQLQKFQFAGCSTETRGSDQALICSRPKVPREYKDLLHGTTRCACVDGVQLSNAHLKPYPGCDPQSNECLLRTPMNTMSR